MSVYNSKMTLTKDAEPQNLAMFQQSFGEYLRQQQRSPDSESFNFTSTDSTHSDSTSIATISSRIGNLYQGLVFNNICGFLDRCFPVCQSLIDPTQWRHSCQQFFLQYHCHSPYFTEINQSFVEYLSQPEVLTLLELPPYFAELAHYEWIELKVDTYCVDPNHPHPPSTNLTSDQNPSDALSYIALNYITLNPSLQNLHYQWPVHRISPDFEPIAVEDSFYLVYRDTDHKVQFMTVNALTHALIEFIDTQPAIALTENKLTALMQDFCDHLGYQNHQLLVSFGLPLIHKLIQQQVVYVGQ